MRGMPLWVLAITLATDKNTGSFSMLDQNDFSLMCHSVQRARQPLSQQAISLGSCTGAGDFMLQLIIKLTKFLPVADKFAMCMH